MRFRPEIGKVARGLRCRKNRKAKEGKKRPHT
jgi:hypothetical protein